MEIEWHTVEVPTKILEVKDLLEGDVREIVVDKYYDLDGDIINEGRDTFKYDLGAAFKITSTKKLMWETEFEDWNILVNGERLDKEWELTSYKYDRKNFRLILKGCTGAG
jgi:hypothetical protein